MAIVQAQAGSRAAERDQFLSVRVSGALKRKLEVYATLHHQTVSEAAIGALEDLVGIAPGDLVAEMSQALGWNAADLQQVEASLPTLTAAQMEAERDAIFGGDD